MGSGSPHPPHSRCSRSPSLGFPADTGSRGPQLRGHSTAAVAGLGHTAGCAEEDGKHSRTQEKEQQEGKAQNPKGEGQAIRRRQPMSTADSFQGALEANPSPPLGTAEAGKATGSRQGQLSSRGKLGVLAEHSRDFGHRVPSLGTCPAAPWTAEPQCGTAAQEGNCWLRVTAGACPLGHLSQPCPLPNPVPLEHCQHWFSLRSRRLPWTTLTPAQPHPAPSPRHPWQSLHGFPLLQEQGKAPCDCVSARREALSTFRA